MHIDDYSFGRMVIDGKTYTSDVIVYPEDINSSWWRKKGHYLQEEDLTDVIAARPDVLVIGTGHSGIMQVPKKTVDAVRSKGIDVFVQKTGEAVHLFNEQSKGRKTVGAFHLTC